MPLAFKPGDPVVIKNTVLHGEVKSAKVIGSSLEYSVAFNDTEGKPQQRYFAEDQLTLTTGEVPA